MCHASFLMHQSRALSDAERLGFCTNNSFQRRGVALGIGEGFSDLLL